MYFKEGRLKQGKDLLGVRFIHGNKGAFEEQLIHVVNFIVNLALRVNADL